MTHTVYLTTPMLDRIALQVEKTGRGRYELVAVNGETLEGGMMLAFEVESFGPEVKNHDTLSDSMSCFNRSEHVETPELRVQNNRFEAASLDQLQKGLNRLRGSTIHSDEY